MFILKFTDRASKNASEKKSQWNAMKHWKLKLPTKRSLYPREVSRSFSSSGKERGRERERERDIHKQKVCSG